jgi:hypothetical protein
MSDSSDKPEAGKNKIGCGGCIAPLFMVLAVFWIRWIVNLFVIFLGAVLVQMIGAPRAQDTSFLLIAILAALATVGELLVLLHPDVYSRISVK